MLLLACFEDVLGLCQTENGLLDPLTSDALLRTMAVFAFLGGVFVLCLGRGVLDLGLECLERLGDCVLLCLGSGAWVANVGLGTVVVPGGLFGGAAFGICLASAGSVSVWTELLVSVLTVIGMPAFSDGAVMGLMIGVVCTGCMVL